MQGLRYWPLAMRAAAVVVVFLSLISPGDAGPVPAPPESAEGSLGVEMIASRSCGLRLDGAGPDARCSRYRDACLRYGNPEVRCNERLDACTRCAVAYQDCEKRATGIARLLTSCDKCIAEFKRCTRDYDTRLPAKRP